MNIIRRGGRGMKKFLDYVKQLTVFFRESKAELKKVSWPTTKQVWYSTAVVVLLTVALGIYLGVLDAVLNRILLRFVG
jgi:preprotein translocase subunit SecE